MAAATSAFDVDKSAVTNRAASGRGSLAQRCIGLAAAAAFPALFWAGLAATTAPAIGFTVTTFAASAFGVAVALFLAAICAPIMLRA
jgi:hypothetical protein